jgi:hypothetical protein
MPNAFPYIEEAAFDDATTKVMGEALDAVCKSLPGTGYSELVKEVIAGRIIQIERRTGETDARRLSQEVVKSLGILL